jgi:large conductance mechanosensitive channel
MASDVEMLEELKKIRELLATKPAPEPPKGMLNEFKDFLSKYKVMGLAVAFIMALYLGALVKALVDDFIMPLITLALPGMDNWENLTWHGFRQGHFLSALITFIIVAIVIFIIVKYTKKLNID